MNSFCVLLFCFFSLANSGAQEPEVASDEPEELAVRAGTDAVLNCASNIDYGRYVCWQRDHSRECYRDAENRIVQVANGSLIIRQVRPSDAGLFTCKLDENADARVAKTWRVVVHGNCHVFYAL